MPGESLAFACAAGSGPARMRPPLPGHAARALEPGLARSTACCTATGARARSWPRPRPGF
eukprot:14223693-Alexandrium_andersonii.AAC.1